MNSHRNTYLAALELCACEAPLYPLFISFHVPVTEAGQGLDLSCA